MEHRNGEDRHVQDNSEVLQCLQLNRGRSSRARGTGKCDILKRKVMELERGQFSLAAKVITFLGTL